MSQIKTTVKYIRRSPYQSLTVILITALTVFNASAFIIAGYTSQKVLQYFENKPQITVFFKDEITQDEINNLQKKLQDTGKVDKMKFVSKKDALEIYKEDNKSDPLLLEMVTESILPASLEISAKDVRFLNDINNLLGSEKTLDGKTEEIVYQRDLVDNLTKWTDAIRKAGIVYLTFLFIVSIFTITTMVGIKIASKKEEIELMKLLGASNWYVRKPFIFESIIYGNLGAVISWIICYVFILLFYPFIAPLLSEIPVFAIWTTAKSSFIPISFIFMAKLLLIELLLGTVISAIGSTITAARYLKD